MSERPEYLTILKNIVNISSWCKEIKKKCSGLLVAFDGYPESNERIMKDMIREPDIYVRVYKKEIEGIFKDANDASRLLVESLCHDPVFSDVLKVIKGIVDISASLGITTLDANRYKLNQSIGLLQEPKTWTNRDLFERSMDSIAEVFDDSEDEIEERISILGEEEESRLNEAIHCFLEGCNYAAVAMCMTAVESRLLNREWFKASQFNN